MPFFSWLRATLIVPMLALAACGQPEQARQPVAAPHAVPAGPAPASCGARLSPEEILQRINQTRAAARRCGDHVMPAARALRWDASLYAAAAGHSQDMANRDYFEHQSPEGRGVGDRATAQNYPWKSVGENIAGGSRTLDEAMRMWLESPDHCRNMMDSGFNEVAIACAQRTGSQWGAYWTMVLGRR